MRPIKQLMGGLVVDAMFVVGVWSIWYGFELLRAGAGFAIVGMILVLYVRPLKGWR